MKKNKKKNNVKQYQRIKTEFTGTQLTQYAGLSVIFDLLKRLKFRDHFDQHYFTPIHNATKHFNWQVILGIVLSNLCGVHRMQAMEHFTADPLVMKLLNLTHRIDANTIASRLTGFGQKGAVLFRESLISLLKGWIAKWNLESVTIDLDSTVVGVYGHQEGAAKGYNPHKKGQKSYHPLLAFVSELKLVVHSWFREGSAYTSNGVCEFAKELKERIPETITNLLVRADSGFFCGSFLDLLESWNWRYIIKVKLKNMEKLLKEQKWTTIDHRVSVCEFTYQCKGWQRSRTLSAIRTLKEHVEVSMFDRTEWAPVYEYACYVSNIEGLTVMDLHSLYAQRGTSENWIEQCKNQLLAGKTLTHDFYANDIFWQCGILAYNVSVMMRYEADQKIWRQEHKSFRMWFIQIPARIVYSARYISLKLYKPYYYRKQWLDFEARVLAFV
jgi:hypothetical protein